MLKVYSGTKLLTMADALRDEFRLHPPDNLLIPEMVVVQNYGMAHWLSLNIAENEGVAANLQFKFPAEIYWQIMRVMDDTIPEDLPSERAPMRWALMYILRRNKDESLQILRQYFEAAEPAEQDMRRWQLAGRIADVFDQYLTYRPDMLMGWEQGELRYQSSTEQWQAALWNKLKTFWAQNLNREWSHRAFLKGELLKAIDERSLNKEKLPERITVFGVSSMPPVYIQMLAKLSKLIPVSFYTMAGETEATHPLAESLGAAGQNFRLLLNQLVNEDQGIEVKHIEVDEIETKTSPSLMQIFRGNLIGNKETSPAEFDATIQVHACHSRRREVEVLYDQLLAMMEEEETINPSDILVLSPNIESYASEVDAVFGSAEEGRPAIPYHLSEPSAQADPAKQAFLKLMELAQSRFAVTDVQDLFHFAPVKKAFELTDEDLNTLERWIGDNKIRWGINGEHKASVDVPETDRFTWQSGLNRMILGYAMNPDEDHLYDDIYPYDEVERSEDAILVGRFSALMNALFDINEEAQQTRSLQMWTEVLLGWVSVFLPDDEKYFRRIQNIRDTITQLKTHAELSAFRDEVSFQIIHSWLKDKLEKAGTGGGRPGKGVTFSSLVTMRNIPARVMCVLGMNDDAFPSSVSPLNFDLIKQDPNPGDRLHSRDDRQLFLETMLAARDRLYFSYVGKSNRQDTDSPPSVVLRELMDFLINRFDIPEGELVTEHRLQAFSPAYFKNDEEESLFSYSAKNRAIAKRLIAPESREISFLNETLPEPDESYKRLTINDLVQFFSHPARYLLQNRFNIYLRDEEVLDEDRESFNLGGLEGYHLGQRLLERYLNNQKLERYKEVTYSRGWLPDGWPGEQAFDHKKAEVKQFGQHLQEQLDQEKLDPIEVDIIIDDFKIAGRLQQMYQNKQMFFRFSKMRAKDLIELWIKHLAFQTVKPQDHSGKSALYTTDDKQPLAIYQLSPISDPVPLLRNLLEWYWTGLRKNIMFFPNTSFAFAHEVIHREKDEQKGLNKASYQWKNEYKSYPLEGDDVYNRCLLDNDNPLEKSDLVNTFKQISIHFWQPFFKVLNEKEERK